MAEIFPDSDSPTEVNNKSPAPKAAVSHSATESDVDTVTHKREPTPKTEPSTRAGMTWTMDQEARVTRK